MDFAISAILLLAALFMFALYKSGWSMTTLSSNIGKGELTGIILASAFFLIIGLVMTLGNKALAEEYSYFKFTEVYAGIDNTFKQSPQCKEGLDTNLTSNLGIKQNLIYSDTFDLGVKYTHHSCAIGVDKNTYDAIGIEISKKIIWK